MIKDTEIMVSLATLAPREGRKRPDSLGPGWGLLRSATSFIPLVYHPQ